MVSRQPARWLVARGVVLGAVAGALVILTAACGSGGSGYGSAAPPAAPPTTAAAAGPTSAAPTGPATQVTASLTEFHIGLSKQTFTAGTYTFAVSNDGQATHALEITGPGLSNAETAFLSPGQKATLTVTFAAGSYDFFCPVANHKSLGMNMNVAVNVGSGSGAGSGGAPVATTAAAGGGGGNGY
jgi:uncharacterized cupredoxin-like copper-binding protein